MQEQEQWWSIKAFLLLWIFWLGWCLQYVSGSHICEKLSNTSDLRPCYMYKKADFGSWPDNENDYIEGVVVMASPPNACTVVTPKKKQNISISAELGIFLLIDGGACDYDVKGLQATEGDYNAAIIRNMDSDSVLGMEGNKYKSKVNIFAIYVGKSAGETLEKYDVLNNPNGRVRIYSPRLLPEFWELEYYMIPFAIIVGICFILMAIFMISRYYRHYLDQRRNRLSPTNLRKIPTKKYKKGDDFYDICAICLEEYKDGERLRILPCEHAYHCKCVDPWLTEGKRTCPVCKQPVENDRRARTGRRKRSELEAAATAGESTNEVDETTPLISSLPSPAPASRAVVA